MHNSSMNCQIYGRPLGQADDPLSVYCGGDCWGCCMGEIEAEMGDPAQVRAWRVENKASIAATALNFGSSGLFVGAKQEAMELSAGCVE